MRAMRSLVLILSVVLALVASACSRTQAPSAPSRVLGDWHGNIEMPGQALAVGVNFANDGKARIDIPAQNIASMALTGVNSHPETLAFTIPKIPGEPSFRGHYDRDSDTIRGDFTQGGQTAPLTLTRGLVAWPPRPQEPRPPYPYKSEDVSYPSGDITIAGTLTIPNGAGPHPTVVLVTGSGPQDRNENILGHKPFLLLADTLTRAGFAVLRTDDRGVGGTGGNLEHATYMQLTDDIAAGMNFLRTRPEIDGARIGLLGHSEGGYLAPRLAARPDSGVAFAVLIAGPSVPGSEVLLEQNDLILRARGATPDEISDQIGFLSGLVSFLNIGDLPAANDYVARNNNALPPDQRAPAEALDELSSPYMAALLNYDPAPALSALRMPVLALFGGKDLQVPAAQNEGPMRALLAADPDATVHTFEGLNHLMQPADKGTPDEYAGIETTMDPSVLEYITGWLTQRFPPR
ncbi:alpha/beta hydrolase family protein [Nocardia sp. NPDC050406]|uniref:alpha/beta hydrolase family protein n=1 Tax=Nocardia sp. NPDC050406 TaxID=3364318 RepID=UPI0037B7324E